MGAIVAIQLDETVEFACYCPQCAPPTTVSMELPFVFLFHIPPYIRYAGSLIFNLNK